MAELDKVRDKRIEQMDKAQASAVGALVRNMTKREQREAVKGCADDVLFDELSRRNKLMNKQINEARKVLRVR